jgi:dihydroxyacetone kinase
MVALLAAAVAQAATATGGLGAGPGDKTVLDALLPMAAVLAAAVRAGASLPETLTEVDEAARRGADATADLVARVGRSARFAERSRGTVDPGAASLAIIVHALVSSAFNDAGGWDASAGSQRPSAAG